MANKKRTYRGLQEGIRSLKVPKIDCFKNKYSDKDYVITVNTNELTCVCPKTGLPDFAVINIDYSPDRFCVELKSFKEYLMFFRSVGIFHEHLTNRILDDFTRACAPRWAKIHTEFNIRGGIKTSVEREYSIQ